MRLLGRPRTFASLTLLIMSLSGSGAYAQSAADKATARQVATEGINLFNEGKYEEALDRMRRAQTLYDAPVHLLYIARAQVQLGHLVDAAENYQLLVRAKLAADAPPVFVSAVEDGRKELAELQPRIPTLQVAVEPKDVEGLELLIDDKPVASAVIGIARPINPGSHRIVVKAPGYDPAERTVDVAEGKPEAISVALTKSVAPPPAPPPPPPPPEEKPSLFGKVGGVLGARIGLSVPTGGLETESGGGGETKTSSLFGTGGGVEIHGGLRLAKYFTAVVFAEVHALSTGDAVPTESTFDLENSANATGIGLGVMAGTERGQLGFFGEVDLLVWHAFNLSGTDKGSDCTVSWGYRSPAVRLGAGGVIPVGDAIHVVPFGMATFGQFGTRTFQASDECPTLRSLPAEGDLDLAERKTTHALFFLGVGGDFVFGGDRPKH